MLRPRTAAAASLLFIPLVAGGFLLQRGPVTTTPRLFEQVMSLVANRYVDSLQGSAIFEKAAHGLVRELNDPYSELLAPKQIDTAGLLDSTAVARLVRKFELGKGVSETDEMGLVGAVSLMLLHERFVSSRQEALPVEPTRLVVDGQVISANAAAAVGEAV